MMDMFIAHGTGPGHDLPIPLFYVAAGGALAVFVSFVAMGMAWPEPKLTGDRAGRRLPLGHLIDSPVARWLLRALALGFTTAVVADAIRLPDDSHVNPVPSIVYAVFWVGLVLASLAFGPVWRLLNPLRTIHELAAHLLRRDPANGRWKLPAWVGYWPAVVGLSAFVWMELVSPTPDSTRTLLWFFSSYALINLTAAAAFGSRWFDRGDAFEVYSDLIGRLAPIGRRHDGEIVLRNPLNGLDTLRPAAGLVAVVCLILAATAFDSITALWDYGTVLAGTSGLLVTGVAVIALYGGASAAAGLIGRRSGVARLFVHSLIPIAVGYLIAHYLQLFIGEAQRAAVLLLRVDWQINEVPLPAGVMALIQVAAIIAGHVLGVMAAHDRAVRLFEPRVAVSGQVPMMVLMVIVTTAGLVLLAAG